MKLAELRILRRSKGLCRDCNIIAIQGQIFCEKHRNAYRERSQKWKTSPRGIEIIRLMGQKRHNDRKQHALCTTCGITPAREGMTKCSQCAATDIRNEQQKKELRVKNGLCIYCGEIVQKSTWRERKSCDVCREKRRGYDGTLSSRFSRVQSTTGAKKYGWSLTFDQYSTLVNSPCNYCTLENLTDQGVGLDRLDNKIGYHIGNVVSCCPECNMVRNAIFTPEEMKLLGETVRRIKLARRQ